MLSPDDIAQRRFLVALRGYDRDEVTTFLQEVADEVRTLRTRVAEMQAQLEHKPSDGAAPVDTRTALESLGQETTRILVVAEQSARDIEARAAANAQAQRDEAQRDARDTVERANRQAARTIAEAERRRDAVAAEMESLREHRDTFVGRLRASVEAISDVVGGLRDEPSAKRPAAAASAPPAQAATRPDVVVPPEPAAAPPPSSDPVVLGDQSDDAEAAEAEEQPRASEPAESTPSTDADEAAPTARDVPRRAAPSDDDGPSSPPQSPAAAAPAVPTPSTPVPTSPTPAAEPTPTPAPAAQAAPTPITEPDEAPDTGPSVTERRDATLGQVRAVMNRQCKRGLQEIQNEVLATLRSTGRNATLEDLLPNDADLDELQSAATDPLATAYRSALADAAAEVGGDTPAGQADGARVQSAVATFRGVLAHEVVSALRATLRAGLEAEEPEPQLSERVGEVFRDLRGPVVEAAVEEHLHRTYGHGLLDAWSELGIEQVRWQANDEPRCPEGRCRTNESEGPLPLGKDFPSGDRVPPAHPGCTCVVLPVRD